MPKLLGCCRNYVDRQNSRLGGLRFVATQVWNDNTFGQDQISVIGGNSVECISGIVERPKLVFPVDKATVSMYEIYLDAQLTRIGSTYVYVSI